MVVTTALSPVQFQSDFTKDDYACPLHASSTHDRIQAFRQFMASRVTSLQSQSQPSVVRVLGVKCTIPMWSRLPIHCADLDDLDELRSRLLKLLHVLRESLRPSGIFVKYQLLLSDAGTDEVTIEFEPSAPIESEFLLEVGQAMIKQFV